MSPIRSSVLALCGLVLPILAVHADDDLTRVTSVAPNQQIPLTDFFRPPLFRNPELNDAGTCFAATLIDAQDGKFGLLVEHLDDGKSETLEGPESYHWLDDNHLLCQVADESTGYFGTVVASVGHLTGAYAIDRRAFLYPLSIPRDDRMEPLIWLGYTFNGVNSGSEVGVLKINAKVPLPPPGDNVGNRHEGDGYGIQATVVHAYPVPAGRYQAGYFCDGMGHLEFAVTETDGYFKLYRLTGDTWTACPVNLDDIDVLGAGDKPGELIVLGPRTPGHPRAVRRLDAATGRLGEVLYQDFHYDPQAVRLYRHPITRQVIGLRFDGEDRTTVWFLKSYKALQAEIERSLPMKNVAVNILGSSLDERRFVISVYSDVMPTAYYSIDLDKGTLGLIKSTRPWIDPARMHHQQILHYVTRDGHRLEGYVTFPSGVSKRHPAPLVVIAHNGPSSRDSWGWDPEAQFLASRGYAVLQPNYRGSLGYGWEFPKFTEWKYGGMPGDVIDGAKALLKTGYVDSSRVAVMGTGFGAYLALSCLESDPSLFRCGVLLSGSYDLKRFMSTASRDFPTKAYYDLMKRHLGDPAKDAAEYDRLSPLQHVDKVKVPVFLSYLSFDRVQDNQARKLMSALDASHVPYEKVMVGEEYRIITFKRPFKIYGGVEAFLARNLGSH